MRPDEQVTIEKLNTTPWTDTTTAILLEVQAGALVMFHGLLPHYSTPSRSNASHHAYTLHVADATAPYSAVNWIQRAADMPVHGF